MESKDDPIMEQGKEETWEEICEYKQVLDRLDYLKCLAEIEKTKGNGGHEVITNPFENDRGRCTSKGKRSQLYFLRDVVTEDGVVFICDKHHVEMSKAKIIWLERRMDRKTWKKIHEEREILYEEDYLDNLTEIKDAKDDE